MASHTQYTVEDIGGDAALRAEILALNNRHGRETTLLDAAKLDRMIEAARVATVAGPRGVAFLIAFDQDGDYDSPNFLWFRERYDRFLYIDRVIVGEGHRRLGLGRLLYEDVLRRAEQSGFARIACEVNFRPPNPESDAFHAKFGFAEVGRGDMPGGDKAVRYLMRASPASA